MRTMDCRDSRRAMDCRDSRRAMDCRDSRRAMAVEGRSSHEDRPCHCLPHLFFSDVIFICMIGEKIFIFH